MKLNNNKFYHRLLLFISLFSIIGTIFFLQWIFFQQTNLKSLDNLYSFSQWSIPLSSRIMGDSSLFQHSGVDLLTKGFDPFKINPETPIFAKLLLGLSITIFNNPHIASVVFLLLLLIFLNLIAQKFFKLDRWHRILLLTLTATSPILLEQVSVPLLDLPQITLFIIHLYFLFSAGINKEKKHIIFYIISSGIALGLMAGTKIALYLPFIFLLDSWYLWKKKKLFYIITIALSSAFTYTFIYFPYILNHGLITWLKAQKWMVNFYFNSNVVATPGMIFITAFTGWYKGWWGSGWERVTAWSGSWGIGMLGTIGVLIESYLKKIKLSYENLYSLFTVILILIPLLIIPFWPRYFVFFIPLFWLNLIIWLKDKKLILLLLLFPLLNLFIIGTSSLKFNPDAFYSNWEKGSYEDMYDYFSKNYKSNHSTKEWVNNQLTKLKEINTYKIEISPENPQKTNFMKKTQLIEVTKTGFKNTVKTKYQLEWILEHNQWKLDSVNRVKQTNLAIETKKLGFICINPTKVEDWADAYYQASNLLHLVGEIAHKRMMALVPRDYCMPIKERTPDPKEGEVIFKPGVKYIEYK